MLREFSRRTTEALHDTLPRVVRPALAVVEPFLAENVAKEIRKDALVIACAGEALAAGRPPSAGSVGELLAEARKVDRAFLSRLGDLAGRLEIPYSRIEPVRARRMQLGLETAYRALAAWRGRRRLRDEFPRGEYAAILRELLGLYIEETLALSESVRLPGLLAPLRRRLAERIESAMRAAADSLARQAPAAEQKG
ncbi:MAG TPA: hypothetical protein VFV84_03125 [Burkholderiales bacterium]|nr:hypothetical protein [Burkholderiales bacterium]